MFLILLMNMLIASAFTLGKAGLDYADPIFLIGFRMVLAGILLLGYQYLFTKDGLRIYKKDWGLFAAEAGIGVFAAYVAEYWAMKHEVSSIKASVFFNLAPFVTAVLAAYILNEVFTRKKFIGLIIGFFGMIPMLLNSESAAGANGFIGFLSFPELILLSSVFFFAYGWIAFKQLMNRGYSPPMINGVAMFFGGILSFGASFVMEGWPVIAQSNPEHISSLYTSLVPLLGPSAAALSMFLLYVSLLILFANVIAYNLFGYLMNFYSTTFLTFTGFTVPLFAALFGWFFRGEQVTWHFWVTMILVFIGLYIFYQDELQLGKNKSLA